MTRREHELAEVMALAMSAIGPAPTTPAWELHLDAENVINSLKSGDSTDTLRNDFERLAVYGVQAFAADAGKGEAELLKNGLAGPLFQYFLWVLARYVVQAGKVGVRTGNDGNADLAEALGLKGQRGHPSLTGAQQLQIVDMFHTQVCSDESAAPRVLDESRRKALTNIFLAMHGEPYDGDNDTHKSRWKTLKLFLRKGGHW